jgi:DNA-binding NarL/FixJ family response regulator
LPDICLLDIEMPFLNGFETSRMLRERYPMIKVVALTVYADDVKRRRMMEAGAYAVLEKNIEPEQLKQALLDALSV